MIVMMVIQKREREENAKKDDANYIDYDINNTSNNVDDSNSNTNTNTITGTNTNTNTNNH